MNTNQLRKFIEESNAIERIHRMITEDELRIADYFLSLDVITIPDLENFVQQFQPDARLRDKPGMDVRVRNHVPWGGGTLYR